MAAPNLEAECPPCDWTGWREACATATEEGAEPRCPRCGASNMFASEAPPERESTEPFTRYACRCGFTALRAPDGQAAHYYDK